MSDFPARKRPMKTARPLDHDAVDARADASLVDHGRPSRPAGLKSGDAVNRLRSRLDEGAEAGTRRRRLRDLRQVPIRLVMSVAGALVLAVVAWVVMIVTDPSPTTAATATSAPAPIEGPPVGVAGFAEIYVAVYLGQAGEGAEHVLEPYLNEPVRLTGLSPGRLYVQNLATVGIEQVADGWVVSVAAQTLRRLDRGYGDPVVQFYRVEVHQDGGFVTDTLSTLIAGL